MKILPTPNFVGMLFFTVKLYIKYIRFQNHNLHKCLALNDVIANFINLSFKWFNILIKWYVFQERLRVFGNVCLLNLHLAGVLAKNSIPRSHFLYFKRVKRLLHSSPALTVPRKKLSKSLISPFEMIYSSFWIPGEISVLSFNLDMSSNQNPQDPKYYFDPRMCFFFSGKVSLLYF